MQVVTSTSDSLRKRVQTVLDMALSTVSSLDEAFTAAPLLVTADVEGENEAHGESGDNQDKGENSQKEKEDSDDPMSEVKQDDGDLGTEPAVTEEEAAQPATKDAASMQVDGQEKPSEGTKVSSDGVEPEVKPDSERQQIPEEKLSEEKAEEADSKTQA